MRLPLPVFSRQRPGLGSWPVTPRGSRTPIRSPSGSAAGAVRHPAPRLPTEDEVDTEARAALVGQGLLRDGRVAVGEFADWVRTRS